MFKRFIKFKLIQLILGLLIAIYMTIVKHTTKWSIENEAELSKIIKNNDAFILITWHSRILMLNAAWTDKRLIPSVLISKSRDGAIITNACRFLGINTIRGSIKANKKNDKIKVSKRGTLATQEIIKALDNTGCIVITPDGPIGPRQHLKKGALRIARITGVPIYPVYFQCTKEKFLKHGIVLYYLFPLTKVKSFGQIQFIFQKKLLIESLRKFK